MRSPRDRLATLIAACERDALTCVICGYNGVKRDATTKVMLPGGLSRLSCSDHAFEPTAINGVSQILGFIPVEQPPHVIAARAAHA